MQKLRDRLTVVAQRLAILKTRLDRSQTSQIETIDDIAETLAQVESIGRDLAKLQRQQALHEAGSKT